METSVTLSLESQANMTGETAATAARSPSAPLPLGVASTALSDEMRTLLDGQRKVHEQILKLQAQIEEEEAAYLEETSHGNIIRGWDGFIDSKQSRKDAALKKVKPYTEGEHLFSSCCFYSTLASEPSLELIDYHRRDEAAGRRRAAGGVTAASMAPGSMSRSSSSTALLKQALERKSSFSGVSHSASGTSTPPTLGRPPKMKKRKRFDRLEVPSTASATQSETGEDDDKEPPPSASLKKNRSTASDVGLEGTTGDFVDML